MEDVASSAPGQIEEEEVGVGIVVEEAGGVMVAAPWLFSERDVRDLMRLKKPLRLDSRFLSVASCTLEDEPFTEGSLLKVKNKAKISKECIFMKSNDSIDFHIAMSRQVFFMLMTQCCTWLLIKLSWEKIGLR